MPNESKTRVRSNLVVQTFLELQRIKTLLNHSRITLWQANTRYETNKPVRHNNRLFICRVTHTSGETFNPNKWDALEASEIDADNIGVDIDGFSATNLGELALELAAKANRGISEWAPNTKYVLNRPIRHNGKLYVCNTTHTSNSIFEMHKWSTLEAGSVKDDNVDVDVEGITATDLKGALQELFQYSNDGKTLISDAIIGLGGSANASDSFALLADAIYNIPVGGAANKIKLIQLNKKQGDTRVVTIDQLDDITDVCTSVYEYVPGEGWVHYDCAFDNGDSSDFTFNADYVEFDGNMKLKDFFVKDFTFKRRLGAGMLFECSIGKQNYNDIESIELNYKEVTENISPVGTELGDGYMYEVDIDDLVINIT